MDEQQTYKTNQRIKQFYQRNTSSEKRVNEKIVGNWEFIEDSKEHTATLKKETICCKCKKQLTNIHLQNEKLWELMHELKEDIRLVKASTENTHLYLMRVTNMNLRKKTPFPFVAFHSNTFYELNNNTEQVQSDTDSNISADFTDSMD